MSADERPSGWPRRLLMAVAVALAAAAGGGTVAIVGPDDDAAPRQRPAVITVAVDGPDADRKSDDKIVAGGRAPDVLADATATPEQFDLSGDLRGEDPGPANVIEGPLATPNWPGCSTRFLPVNFSSRNGQKITGFGLHYTAGPNITGLADMNGLTAFASRASAGVSWHFLIDAEGHCYYSVPVSMKAWTIGNLNGQTINVEMIGRGNEPTYGGTAGMRKLGEVVRRAARIYGFPVRLGAVDGNCRITRPGIITHWMGGSCAGGHADIRPYAIEKVVAQIASGGVTATDRVTCRKLSWWRRAGRPQGEPQRKASRRKAALAKRGVTCTARGPVRA